MSDDFLQELRTEVNGELGRLDAGSRWGVMISKAADEIERLRAENERLLAVAKGDARILAAYHQWCKMNGCAPSSSDLSAALAALAEEKK